MIQRYNIEICSCSLGVHIEAKKDNSGDWIKYEDFKNSLIVQTCLDYFRTPEKSEKWLDEHGTELLKLELNSIQDVKQGIVNIMQRVNKEKENEK